MKTLNQILTNVTVTIKKGNMIGLSVDLLDFYFA